MNITRVKELIQDIETQYEIIKQMDTLLKTEKFENINQLMTAGTLLFMANRTVNVFKSQLIQEINQ